MKAIVITLLLLLSSNGTSYAQEWSGIKLLQSACDDVKRGLGVDKCEYPKSVYRFPRETVTVGFVVCPCPIRCYHASGGWNVPRGTVSGITRQFFTSVSIEEFDVKNGNWATAETDMIGQLLYTNTEEGILIDTLDGKVLRITYIPSPGKHEDKACPPCTVPPSPSNAGRAGKSLWLRGYDGRDAETEERLLDEFAAELRKQGNFRGYIMATDGCLKRGEAAILAERAKKYLVNIRGIDSSRIIIIDAGQDTGLAIELHVRERTAPSPAILSSEYPKVTN
jgi:hypothetical protein